MNSKTLVNLIILGILSPAIIVFFIFPLFEDIRINATNFLLRRQNLTNFESKRESLSKVANYGGIKANLDKLNNLFIDPKPVNFIVSLENLARDNNLLIKVSLSQTKEKKEQVVWPSITAQVLLDGKYSDFMIFLEKIESGNFLISISDLSIKKLTVIDLNKSELKSFTTDDVEAVVSLKAYTK